MVQNQEEIIHSDGISWKVLILPHLLSSTLEAGSRPGGDIEFRSRDGHIFSQAESAFLIEEEK